MRVLAVTSEYFPLVKTGGLADVAGALPAALAGEGIEVRSLIPGYPAVVAAMADAESVISHNEFFGGPARLLFARNLFVLDAPHLFDRPGNPYAGPDGRDWPDNLRRFAALSRMAADIALGALPGWRPDLVHVHDWQAGLVPAYLRHSAAAHPPTAITVHNLAFQGRFPAADFPILGLPPAAMRMEELEFHGDLSLLKAGLVHADRVTTVSPTYAAEIQTPEHGMGLDGVLRATGVTGILNGIDTAAWNPATDPDLPQTYQAATLKNRSVTKAAVQSAFGLPQDPQAPLFAVISRLSWQKGLDLLLQAIPALLEAGGQLALLGTGDPELEAGFRAASNHSAVACQIGYDEPTAHRLQGGADALLVPSRFEPCGLTQLCALRYGCVPVVARVGGLADTVPPTAGLSFSPVTAAALSAAIAQAAALFRRPNQWRRLQRNGMATDVSWRHSARQYATLFRSLAAA